MPRHRPTTRRKFLMTAIAASSLAGCLGEPKNRPGVIDENDLTVESNGSENIALHNVNNDNNKGLKITTDDTVNDGTVTATLPVSIPEISKSSIFVQADVSKLDDDTEVEIRFHTDDSTYRSAFIGNEYKDQNNGVLATETGTGYSLRKKFLKLPSDAADQKTETVDLDTIQFVIRDGDITASIWALHFIFDKRTVAIL